MKLIKIHKLIREAKEELNYLVYPTVKEDIRSQLGKLTEALELLEECDMIHR